VPTRSHALVSSDRPLERAILLQDLAVLVVALLVSAWARDALVGRVPGLKPAPPQGQTLLLLLAFVPTWGIGAHRNGLHRLDTIDGPRWELVRRVLLTHLWGTFALALILFAAQAPLNRSLIALFLVTSTALLLLVKVPQRHWLRRAQGRALALVLGSQRGGRQGEIEHLRGRRVEVLEEWTAVALRSRLQAGGVDEVVVSPTVPRESVRPLLDVCDDVGVPALVAIERMDLGLPPPQAEVVGRTLFLTYRRLQTGRPALMVKAVGDRLTAALGLVLLAPLLLLVALLVRLTSRGPALFVQQRGGLNGHAFPMFKFRTMREGAEAERESLMAENEMDGPVFKIARDPRVTPLGSVLRRTSLDELPQLLNVVAGHMSLVGPRPLPVVETRELTGSHRRRLSMRPGITGLWQVSGRNDLSFAEWMALDLQYVDDWSLGLDLAILLRTLPALVTSRGAY